MTGPVGSPVEREAVETPNVGPWNDEARCARRCCQHPQSWHDVACDEDTCPCPGFMDPAAQEESRPVVEGTASSGGPVVTAEYANSSRPVVSSPTREDEPDEALVERAAEFLLNARWEWRVGEPVTHRAREHYSADCPLCRPDYGDNAKRIVRVVLAAVRDA